LILKHFCYWCKLLRFVVLTVLVLHKLHFLTKDYYNFSIFYKHRMAQVTNAQTMHENSLLMVYNSVVSYLIDFRQNSKVASCTYSDCQMVYFQTKNRNLGKFWRTLQWKMLIYIMDFWSSFRPFDTVYGNFAYLVVIRCIFPCVGKLYQEKSGKPVTCTRSTAEEEQFSR
jgi:hypothetical protein